VRKHSNSAFDFGVTVRAEQRALCGLGTKVSKRPGDATDRQTKTLCLWIEVMELQRAGIPVITADRALSSGFLDK